MSLPTRRLADRLQLDGIHPEWPGPPVDSARRQWRRLLTQFPALAAAVGADLFRVDYPRPPSEPKLIAQLTATLISDPELRGALLAALAPDLVPLVEKIVEQKCKGGSSR
jgi:hypothetical protein